MSKTKPKNPVGRPSKFPTLDIAQIERLAGYGLTQDEIAREIGVTNTSIKTYKNTREVFLAAIKDGVRKADKEVIRSLYQRATGYDHLKTMVFCYQGQIVTHEVMEHWPPDVAASFIWLKNRRGWRDKPEGDSGLSDNELKILRDEAAKIMREKV